MHWLTAILILAAIVASSMAVGWLATFAVARRRHQRALTLVDLFDQGTTKIDGTHSLRNYFLRPSVAGAVPWAAGFVFSLRGYCRVHPCFSGRSFRLAVPSPRKKI